MRDPHYGEVLFHFYQNRHFDAMVHLLSARQQGRMQAYDEEPELLLGGLYLAYGMNGEAEILFKRVLEHDPSPEIYDRLANDRHLVYLRDALPRLESDAGMKSDPIHLNREGYRQLGVEIHELLQAAGAVSDVN